MTDDLLRPGWRSRLVTVGELKLHLVTAGPEDGKPIILLHGFPEFWWAWRHLLDSLANGGFRVVAPDMRGYNLSDAPAGVDAYRTDRLADDVVALADAFGFASFDLVGHDWGGIVAWAVAARSAERLNRLVIMDAPHPGAWSGFMLRHPSQAVRSAYVGWFQLPLAPEAMLGAFGHAPLRAMLRNSARKGVFSDDVLDQYAMAWRGSGRLSAMINYYRALPRSRVTAPARLDIPTLILWGGRDRFLDIRLAEQSACLCTNATVSILPEATHWLHLEEPDRVADEVRSFCS